MFWRHRAPNEMQKNGRPPAGTQGCDQSLDLPKSILWVHSEGLSSHCHLGSAFRLLRTVRGHQPLWGSLPWPWPGRWDMAAKSLPVALLSSMLSQCPSGQE